MKKYNTYLTKVLSFLFVSLMTVNAWGVDAPTLSDLNLGTPLVSENFNSVSTSSTSALIAIATSQSSYGEINSIYNNNASNVFAISASGNNLTSNYLSLTSGSGSPLIGQIKGKSFSQKGVWRATIEKTSIGYIGLYNDASNANATAYGKVSAYIKNDNGTITIQTGTSKSVWTAVGSSSNNLIDICVVYNLTNSSETYGGSITLGSMKAHVYIDGTCVNSAGTPTAFTMANNTDVAAFRVATDANGNHMYVDDIKVYSSLPTQAGNTITLDKNGGDTDGSALAVTDATSLSNISAPTKTGYHVEGYYTTSEPTTKIATAAGALQNGNGSGITVSGNVWTNSSCQWKRGADETFYTKWTANSYTVTFDKNGGGTGTGTADQTFTYGTAQNLRTCGFTAPTHKFFIGWNTDKDATTALYEDGEEVNELTSTKDGTVTLYAIWKDHTYTNYRTSCCTRLGAIGITVEYTDPTTAVLTWNAMSNVDATTPYTVTYRTGSDDFDDDNVGSITTNGAGKKTCTITELSCNTDYDFKIEVTAASGYCDKDSTLEDKNSGKWNVDYTMTNVQVADGIDEGDNACGGFSVTFEPTSGAYALPSTISVTIGSEDATSGTDYDWNDATGELTIDEAKVTGAIAVTVTGVEVGCLVDPTLGAASLKTGGTFNLGQVDVTVATSSAGDYCEWADYGFVWGTSASPALNSDGTAPSGVTKVQVGTSGEATTWDGSLKGSFSTGTTYYYRAYGKNGKDDAAFVYGTGGTFTPRSVEFNSNGGSAVATVYVNSGGTVSAPTPAPTKTGHTFDSWRTTSGLTTEMNFSGAITKDTTLYAKWTVNTYSLAWDKNASDADALTGTYTSGASIAYGTSLTAPNTPTRTGYTFDGWNTATDGSGDAYTGTMPAGNTTYYAQWTINNYSVTWKVNDKAYTTGDPSTSADYNTKVSKLPTAPADNTLNSCANTFIGWTDATNGSYTHGTSSLYTNIKDFPNITTATIYYAVFAESVPATNYTWTLDYTDDRVGSIITEKYGVAKSVTASDGGSWTVKAYKNSGMQINTGKDCSIKIPDCEENIKTIAITCSASKAVGFSTADYDGSGTITYQVSGSDATSQTLDFTGKSLKSGYIVPKTGSTAITRIVVTYGTPAYMENYVTKCDGTTARVTYSANGGSGMICANGVYDKEGFTTCDNPPHKTGYTFAGWSDGTNTHDADAAFTLTQDTTFTASWSIINYAITYHLNDGTNDGDNPTTYTIADADITLKDPTRNDGHDRFEGWFDNEDLEGDPITTIESGSTGAKEYWASWTERYHVEFYKEDSRVVEIWRAADEDISASVAGQGTKPSDPSTPTLCGSKVFVGWSGSTIDIETDTKPADLKSTAKGFVTSDTVVHAVWATKTSNTPPGTYAGTGVFERITDLSDMTTNTYYVLYGIHDATYKGAMNNTVTSSKAGSTAVTISNNKITNPGTAIVWKLGGTKDAYTLYNQAASKYIEITSNATDGYALNSPATTSYTVSYTDAKGFFFKSNHASANSRGISYANGSSSEFRAYQNGANAQELQLYKWPEYLYSDYSTYCFNVFDDGNSSHTWNDDDNWSGDVPSISERVLIQKPVTVDITDAQAKEVILDKTTGSTGKLEIRAGKALVVAESVKKTTDGETLSATAENDIVIGSSASGNGVLVMGGHDGTNKATVYFYSLAKKETTEGKANWYNQHIGTPFSSGRGVLYDYYESYLYSWDAENQKWVNIKDGSTHFTPFLGYNVLRKSSTPGTFEMEGTLVESETQVLNLTYNEGELEDNENVLANSWTAPIDIVAIGSESFYHCQATIYIMNAGGPEDIASAGEGAVDAANPAQWIVLPLASVPWTSPTLTKIPPMQGFSVYATGADPTLTLNYGTAVYTPALTNATPPPTRAPKRTQDEDPEVMHLRVEAESGYADVVCMLIREDFSDEFENGWDGTKIFGQAIAPQLYAFSAGGNMAVNCIDNAEGTVLGFRKGSDDNRYTFSFSYDGDEMWYLNDQLEQKSTLISNDRTYDFYADESDTEARFVISRSPISKTPTGIGGGEAGSGEVRKLLINNHVYIVRNGKIYHVDGGLIR